MTRATAPAAIIQLPVRDDILITFYEDEKKAFSPSLGYLQIGNAKLPMFNCQHSEFSVRTPDDESHRLRQIACPRD